VVDASSDGEADVVNNDFFLCLGRQPDPIDRRETIEFPSCREAASVTVRLTQFQPCDRAPPPEAPRGPVLATATGEIRPSCDLFPSPKDGPTLSLQLVPSTKP
jgi:hypothetical protein